MRMVRRPGPSSSRTGSHDRWSTKRLCQKTVAGPVRCQSHTSGPHLSAPIRPSSPPRKLLRNPKLLIPKYPTEPWRRQGVPSEDRQAIGQLLVRLLHEFRVELAALRADLGYGDIREAHMQIFGNIATGDIRLTDLAARAQLSLAATSELVNELVSLGYLDRRPIPRTVGPNSSSSPSVVSSSCATRANASHTSSSSGLASSGHSASRRRAQSCRNCSTHSIRRTLDGDQPGVCSGNRRKHQADRR